MKSALRRELAWICLPLVLLIGAGAWISTSQNERNAEKRRRESGPLRVRVWGIRNTGAYHSQLAKDYRYGFRIDAHLEGRPAMLASGEVWMMRVKSAQIATGKTSKPARVVHVMSPLILGDKRLRVRPDVLAVTDIALKPCQLVMWVYCDSALATPTLEIQTEAIAGKVISVSGSSFDKTFVPSHARLVAPVEKIPLRAYSDSDPQSMVIKSEY